MIESTCQGIQAKPFVLACWGAIWRDVVASAKSYETTVKPFLGCHTATVTEVSVRVTGR